jgi:hypothetical protein
VRYRSFAIIGVLFAAATSGAQVAGCDASTPAHVITQNACVQAVDVFQYMAPQLGLAIAGGNATIGQGSVLGGLGHFSLGVRANGIWGTVPQIKDFPLSATGYQQSTLPTENKLFPLPTADAAFGIISGLPVGLTNVGGVDLLVNVSYIPTVNSDNFSVKPDAGSIKYGYGARVGILQESIVVPGVSVTYLRRDLPTTSLTGSYSSVGNTSTTLSVSSLDVQTTAWRVTASKHFVIFGFVVGYGQDKYDQSGNASGQVTQGGATFASQSVSLSQNLTRTNMFADLSFNLPLFKIVGEVGQASGGTVTTNNKFAGTDAGASRQYASAGLRLSW